MLVYPLQLNEFKALLMGVLKVVDNALMTLELVPNVISPTLSLPSANPSTYIFAAALSASQAEPGPEPNEVERSITSMMLVSRRVAFELAETIVLSVR